MRTQQRQAESRSTAATVAPEDLRSGDFIAILSETVELPSFFWDGALPAGRNELVRLSVLPTDDRPPRKVEAICLPYVFVTLPDGGNETLDVRLANLVRLDPGYARTVWKAKKRRQAKTKK